MIVRIRLPLALLSAVAAAAAGLSASCEPRPGNITQVWANDGGDKVLQDELRAVTDPASVANAAWDGTRIKQFGARNEVVSLNLVIEAPEATARGVSVSLPFLAGPGGAIIGSGPPASGGRLFEWVGRNIELFLVRYLQVRGLSRLAYENYDERHAPVLMQRPWTGEGEARGGWSDRPGHDRFYPDIAVPLDLVPSFDIAAGRSQSVWVDIYIPRSAPAGTYAGTVFVRERGAAAREIPIELKVLDFTLPEVPSAKTMVFLGYRDLNVRYLGVPWPLPGPEDEAATRIRDRHFLLAHRHKVSLIDADPGATVWTEDAPRPEWLPRLDGTLFTAANGYDGPGLGVGNGVYSIGTYGTWGWQDEGEAGMRSHTDGWASWFEAHSPATEHFLYLIDESSDYPRVETWARWLNENPGPGNGVKSLATIFLPDAAAFTPSLDIATAGMAVGDTVPWANAAIFFGETPGKGLYMYNGKRPATGSFAIEDEGVALREIAWGQYKMGIHRWFFWESTYYNNFQGGTGETNVFQSAFTFGTNDRIDPEIGETGWNHSNGDGVLFYPGTDTVYPAESLGIPGPIASLRLKQWRRGIQDVDYLAMAAAVDPAGVASIVNRIIPKALWEYGVADPSDPSWVRCALSWSNDPDVWERARADLAQIILGGMDAGAGSGSGAAASPLD